MTLDDMPAFAEVLAVISETYHITISEIRAEFYWQILQRFSIEQIREGLVMHANHPERGKFAPQPSDLISAIEGSTSDRAMLAWTKVLEAMKHVGSYGSVIFDDLLIHAVISDLGGWVSLCRLTEHELVFRSKEFEKRYQIYCLRQPTTYPNRLIGQTEQHHTQDGLACPAPVLIGNQQLALTVHKNGTNPEQLKQFSRLPSAEKTKPIIHQLNQKEPNDDQPK